MNARDAILGTVRANLPRPVVPLPDSPTVTDRDGIEGGVGYSGHLSAMAKVGGFPDEGESVVPYFRRHLEAMGGQPFEVANAAGAAAKVAELFPAAKVVCSATP